MAPRFELFYFSVLWREIEIKMKVEMAREIEIEMEMGRYSRCKDGEMEKAERIETER